MKFKKAVATLFFIILPVFVFANPTVDQLISFYTFNADWTRADSLLDAQIRANPDQAKYYALKAPFYFYTRYFAQAAVDPDSLMENVLKYSQTAIAIGEKEDMTLDDKLFVGTAYGFQSRYYGRRTDFWDAFWAARACRNYLNEVIDEDPSRADAYLGLAVIEYFSATRLTGFYGFIAWLVGMDGDREVALQKFELVAEKGIYFKDEARFILSMLYRYIEEDLTQAQKMNETLAAQFPGNNFIALQNQQVRFLSLIEVEGIDVLEDSADSLDVKYGITNPGILNGLGYTLTNQNRLDDAIRIFELNVRLFPDNANVYDSLSETYEAAGKYELAIKTARICLEKLEQDQTINDEFRVRLRQISNDRINALESRSADS